MRPANGGTIFTWLNLLRFAKRNSCPTTLQKSSIPLRIVRGVRHVKSWRDTDIHRCRRRNWVTGNLPEAGSGSCYTAAAARRRFSICATNHSATGAYISLLWEQWLDEPTADIPLEAETNTTTIISEFNAGGLTHEEIWLRYYAEESDHKFWPSTEPDFVFPPHVDPPHDRDRFLPTPPVPLDSPRRLASRATTIQPMRPKPIRSDWTKLIAKSPLPKLNQGAGRTPCHGTGELDTARATTCRRQHPPAAAR